MVDALFSRLPGGAVLPGPFARGPWSPDALHGGPVSILLASAAEELLEDLFPARISVELVRAVPVAPLTVTAEVTRPGRRVRLVDARVATEDGTVVATARVLGIRRAELVVPDPVPVEAPAGPETVAPPQRGGVSTAQDYDAFHNCGVEHRWVKGSFLEEGPATDWIRLAVPVFEGALVTPLQRLLAAADFGNGVSRMAAFEDLLFINPDLTVHLHRLPAGEWVCLDAVSVLEPHGVGLAQSALWDEEGLLGRSLQSLLLDARG